MRDVDLGSNSEPRLNICLSDSGDGKAKTWGCRERELWGRHLHDLGVVSWHVIGGLKDGILVSDVVLPHHDKC